MEGVHPDLRRSRRRSLLAHENLSLVLGEHPRSGKIHLRPKNALEPYEDADHSFMHRRHSFQNAWVTPYSWSTDIETFRVSRPSITPKRFQRCWSLLGWPRHQSLKNCILLHQGRLNGRKNLWIQFGSPSLTHAWLENSTLSRMWSPSLDFHRRITHFFLHSQNRFKRKGGDFFSSSRLLRRIR